MAPIVMFVILLTLALSVAQNFPDSNSKDMKSALEEVLQKLDVIQQTVTSKEDQMFNKLNKRIESLEVKLMARVEKSIKKEIKKIKSRGKKMVRDLFDKMTALENQVISSCSVKPGRNEIEIVDLKEQVNFLLNRSGGAESCKPCYQMSLGPTGTKLESSTPTTTSISTSTTTTATTATQTTSTEPPSDKTFLLVGLWSSYFHHLRDINFKDEEVFYKVSYKNVDSAACAPNRQQVFVSTYTPDQIIQVNGNGRDTKRIKMGIKTLGMTVDNSLNYIFLTSGLPKNAIYSMTTEGKEFKEILGSPDLERNPRAIAVNPKTQVIYASDDTTLFSVNYDGSNFTNITFGGFIYAIAVDADDNVLYFSSANRIYKMNLETYDADNIIVLNSTVYNLEYYADKLFFTLFNDPTIGVIDLAVEQPTVIYTRKFQLSEVGTFVICPK